MTWAMRWTIAWAWVLAGGTTMAVAADWKPLPAVADGAPRIAYDAAAIRFEPPHVTTWTRVELPAAATLGNAVRYRSALQKIAVDCPGKTWGIVHSDFYASADALGVPVFSDTIPREEWVLRPAREGSTGAALIRALCTTPRPW